MYTYNYRLFDRYNRMVVSLAVLADERAGWRPDRFGYSLWGCTVGFQFPVVKLLDYAAEEAALEFLASWNPPSLARQGYRRTKRKKQMGKRWRQHHRR